MVLEQIIQYANESEMQQREAERGVALGASIILDLKQEADSKRHDAP
ncbi:hypothetical protein J2Y41_003929 [Arthrobacter sp. 1088]|nr:hypothetical protein [Arthrobacter sp. 1088]MDR6688343.1 hypothetical protein [Arthrobacter sp. 1088]